MQQLNELLKDLDMLLLKDARKQKVIDYYTNDPKYIESLVRALKLCKNFGASNVIKTTRAGYTTNAILAALYLNRTITVVEPTNKIAEDTVGEALDIYRKSTGDFTKIVRHITSNNRGCSAVIEKIEGSEQEGIEGCEELNELNYLLGDVCRECNKDTYDLSGIPIIPPSTAEVCMIKTIIEEKIYLFDWSEFPVIDSINLLDYLAELGADWVKGNDVELKKVDDIIIISDSKRTITIELEINDKKINVKLKMPDNRFYSLIAAEDAGPVKVYAKVRPDIVTATYDKLIVLYDESILKQDHSDKNWKFRSLISSSDICLLDEMGTFVEKLFPTLTWLGEGSDLNSTIKKIKGKIVTDENEYLYKYLNDYLTPFVNGLEKELDKEIGYFNEPDIWNLLKRPKVLSNPLDTLTSLSGNRNRLDELKNKKVFSAIRHAIEDAITDASTDNSLNLDKDDVILLDDAFTLIRTPTLTFAKISSDGDKIIISAHDQNTKIKSLQMALRGFKSSNKILLISDATMPPFFLERICGFDRVEDRFYGDPLNTNDKALLITCALSHSFDTIKWSKDGAYQAEAAQAIAELSIRSKNLGQNLPIVWCTNQDIAEQLVRVLQTVGCDAKILNDKNINDGITLVSHYKSVYSRGVANNRRIHIALGNAHKPKKSFAGLVLGTPGLWNILDEQDKNSMKKEVLELFNLNEIFYIPDDAQGLFDHVTDTVQEEYTYADSWQAMSRSKDPSGIERCAIICIGWKDDEVLELRQQGANSCYDYTTNIRFHRKPDFVLPSPHISDDINDLEIWLKGEDIEEGSALFAWGITWAIFNMFCKNRMTLLQSVVYTQFAKHTNLSADDVKNGMFVGLINLSRLHKTFIQTRVEFINGENLFIRDETADSLISAGKNLAANQDLINDIGSVLKVANELKDKVLTGRAIKQKLRHRLTNERIQEMLEYIDNHNLLMNSSWLIQKDNQNNFTIMKNNVAERVLEIIKELTKANKRILIKKNKIIQSWQVNNQIRLTQTEIEKIFNVLDQHLMLPSNMRFKRRYYKYENVIVVS